MKTRRNIRDYSDYRQFLLDYGAEKKAGGRTWSLGAWSKSLGLQSTSSLSKVLQGDRTPGHQMIERFVAYFKFNSADAEYFRDLIRFAKAKDEGLRALIQRRIQQGKSAEPIRRVDYQLGAVIANWCAFPIRELAKLPSFTEDPVELVRKFLFPITLEQVKAALGDLLSAGLLVRDQNGKVTVPSKRVATGDDVPSDAIKKYHQSMLDNAKESLWRVPVEQREFFGSTLVVSSADIGDMKLFIREFRSKFASKFEAPSGDQIYQIQLQLFPLLKPLGGEVVKHKTRGNR